MQEGLMQALQHLRQFEERYHRALKRAALAGLLVPDPVRVDLLALPRMLRLPKGLLTHILMFTCTQRRILTKLPGSLESTRSSSASGAPSLS